MPNNFWILYVISFAMGYVFCRLVTEIRVYLMGQQIIKDAESSTIEFDSAEDMFNSPLFKALPDSVKKEIMEEVEKESSTGQSAKP